MNIINVVIIDTLIALFFYGIYKREKSILSFITGTVFLIPDIVLVIITALILFRVDSVFTQIPYTEIDYSEDGIVVDNSGTFILDSSQSAQSVNQFIINDSTNLDELAEWLENTTKNTYIRIVNGSDLVAKINLGVVDETSGTYILSQYNNWKADGTLEYDYDTYKFLCFYLEV